MQHDLNINFLERPQKQGLAFAKNEGLSIIDTEWVAFLDADDYFLPTKLEKQMKFIEKNKVDFFSTQVLILDGSDIIDPSTIWDSDEYEDHESIKNVIYDKNILAHGSFLIRKKCIDELGGYNHVIGMEDWDLWKRAVDSGNYIFHRLNERLYMLRVNTSVPR